MAFSVTIRERPTRSLHGGFRPLHPTISSSTSQGGDDATPQDIPYRLPRLSEGEVETSKEDMYKVWSRHGYDFYSSSPKPTDLLIVSGRVSSTPRPVTMETRRSQDAVDTTRSNVGSSYPKFGQAAISPVHVQPRLYAGNVADPAFHRKSNSLEDVSRRNAHSSRVQGRWGPTPPAVLPPGLPPIMIPPYYYPHKHVAMSVASEPVHRHGAFLPNPPGQTSRQLRRSESVTRFPDLHYDPSPTPIQGQNTRSSSPAKSVRSIHWTLSPVKNQQFDKKGGSRCQGPYSREFIRKCRAPSNWMKMKWGRSKTTMA